MISEFIIYKYNEAASLEALLINSYIDLGKYSVDLLLDNISGITINHLKEYASKILRENLHIKTDEDFYSKFCRDIIRFSDLPKNTHRKLLLEYESTKEKINKIISTIDNRINTIQGDMLQLENEKADIVNRNNLNNDIMKNLAAYENELLNNIRKSKELYAEKETLEYSRDFLIRELDVFADETNEYEIKHRLKKYAFDISRRDDSLITAEMKFAYYNDVLDITESNIKNVLVPFFKVKVYKEIEDVRRYGYKESYLSSKDEWLRKCEEKIKSIPKPDELINLKQNNNELYRKRLQAFIKENNVVEFIKTELKRSYCVRERKGILLKVLDFFQEEDYIIFNNIAPVQIEGLFSDFLMDATMTQRFKDLRVFENAVLREKIQYLENLDTGIYPEAVLHFKYYYNHFIRNPIAHGDYHKNISSEYEEVFALELLLDLNFLVYMISRQAESNKIIEFITGFYHSKEKPEARYRVLLSELNAGRLHSSFDSVYTPDPLKSVYWITNKFFDEIYVNAGIVDEVAVIRKDLCSVGFWTYVEEYLNAYGTKNIHEVTIDVNFIYRVKSLFSYIRENNLDALTVLASVHDRLKSMEI